MKSDFNSRLTLFQAMLGLMLVGVLVRVVVVQNSPEAELFRKWGASTAWTEQVIKPERGRIYDRNGNMLAGNKIIYEISLSLKNVQNKQDVAMTLANVLGRNYEELLGLIESQPDTQYYLPIDMYATREQGDAIIALQESEDPQSPNLAGVDARQRLSRSYPNGSLASNVLGFVLGNDQGNYGVEEEYDTLLAGTPIRVLMPNDPTMAGEYPNPPKGTDLILTIDREVQAMVEKTLNEGLKETGAKRGTIIVMDPKTGEILGMANTPQLDLNETHNFLEMFPLASDYNVAVSTQYEPGSVFKILTMAAALDSGIVTPGTTYMDTGYYEVNGVNIFNWDRGAWGVQDMTGCLKNSLNVCMARLVEQMGPDTFYSYLNKFGIGRETGIDIAVEARGDVKDWHASDPSLPNPWIPLDMAVNSFGQGVAVSPIQMLTAASAMANDGNMMSPHIVKAMVTNGNQVNTPIQVAGTPIKPETARSISNMLALALDDNESAARVDGYRIAGKTGTASIPGPDGFYDDMLTNQSFVGWGPVDDPRFIVYIWFEQPTLDEWASIVVSPIFHNVVQNLVVMLDLPPDSQRQQLISQAGQ